MNRAPGKTFPTWFWLGAIMVLALALRLFSIERDSLWLDEAISYLAVNLPLNQILNNTIESSHPPVYYLLLRTWQFTIPDTDIGLKSLSVILNIFLVPAIYGLGMALFHEKRLSLLAALLVAISPFQILYSHEVRMYTLVMLLVTLGVWAYWRAWETMKWRYWLLFGMLFILAVYTHLFSFLVLAGIGLFALVNHHKRAAFWRTCAIILGILFLFSPWLALILGEAQQELGSLRPLQQETSRNPIKPISALAFILFGLSDSFFYTGLILFAVLGFLIIFTLEIRKIKREDLPTGLILIGLILLCMLGVPLLVYLLRPFFLPERTLAAASPFLILLLAWSATRRQSPLPYLVGGMVIIMAVGTMLYHQREPLKPPYQAAVAWVAANKEPGDVVLHTSDGSYLPALRYADWENHWLLAGDPDPRKTTAVYEAVGGQVIDLGELDPSLDRLWLIVALEHSLAWQNAQAAYFSENFGDSLAEKTVGGIQIHLYDLSRN